MGRTQYKNIQFVSKTQPSRSGFGIESEQQMGYGNGGSRRNLPAPRDSGHYSQAK